VSREEPPFPYSYCDFHNFFRTVYVFIHIKKRKERGERVAYVSVILGRRGKATSIVRRCHILSSLSRFLYFPFVLKRPRRRPLVVQLFPPRPLRSNPPKPRRSVLLAHDRHGRHLSMHQRRINPPPPKTQSKRTPLPLHLLRNEGKDPAHPLNRNLPPSKPPRPSLGATFLRR
jgi:hypothetical protein